MERTLKNTAVNYHITEKCNMACKFCFAKYRCKSELNTLEALALIDKLAEAGISKINFAGGEPFIRYDLGMLIKQAATRGLITGVITNGSFLTIEWIKQYGQYLNWLGVSIDSLTHETNISSGRCSGGSITQDITQVYPTLALARKMGIPIKINTVVSQYNLNEDLNVFIQTLSPDRWKIFQVLPIENANRNDFNFEITNEQYQGFLSRHEHTRRLVDSVAEDNHLMRDSYIMINPEGKFFDNSTGSYSFSEPILHAGALNTFTQVQYDPSAFLAREGQTAITRSIENAS